MTLERRPSASLRPFGEEKAEHFCDPSNLNTSMLVQWRASVGRAACKANTVLTADNCFDLMVCSAQLRHTTMLRARATVPALIDSATQAWARIAADVQARYESAHGRPPLAVLADADDASDDASSGASDAASAKQQRTRASSAAQPPAVSVTRHVSIVAVHIRRGDTVLQQHRHMGDTMLRYFNRTMSVLRERYAHADGRPGARFVIVTDEHKPHWVFNQTTQLPPSSDDAYSHFFHAASGGYGTSFGTWSQRTAVHRLFGSQPDVAIADGTTLTEDFETLVHADVFVMSLSSLSYTAALLRAGSAAGAVIAPGCMHAITTFVPLASWELAECCPAASAAAAADSSTGPPPPSGSGRRLSHRHVGVTTGAPPPPPTFC